MSEGMKIWAIGWFCIMFILVMLEVMSAIQFNKKEEKKRQERIKNRLKKHETSYYGIMGARKDDK